MGTTMLQPQISVMMPNAPGRLHEVTVALAEAGVNLRAMTVTDAPEFGVLRFLPSDLERARAVLGALKLPVRVDEVLALSVPDEPGSLERILAPLEAGGINLDYLYGVSGRDGAAATLVFRFRDPQAALAVLEAAGTPLTPLA